MDRRDFVEGCALGAGALAASIGTGGWAAQAAPRRYAAALLVDELGDPVKASQLKPQTNYVFHYPFEATPVFLLDLGKAAMPMAKLNQPKASPFRSAPTNVATSVFSAGSVKA